MKFCVYDRRNVNIFNLESDEAVRRVESQSRNLESELSSVDPL